MTSLALNPDNPWDKRRLDRLAELPTLVNAREAAKYLGYSVGGLIKLAKQGKIPYYRTGDGKRPPFRFNLEEIDKVFRRAECERESVQETIKIADGAKLDLIAAKERATAQIENIKQSWPKLNSVPHKAEEPYSIGELTPMTQRLANELYECEDSLEWIMLALHLDIPESHTVLAGRQNLWRLVKFARQDRTTSRKIYMLWMNRNRGSVPEGEEPNYPTIEELLAG